MKTQVITAPHRDIPIYYRNSLFLAGGISNCLDWQAKVIKFFGEGRPCTLINPRRANFDLFNQLESEEQIKWEFEYLRQCSHVMFWFCKETVCPITLLELGATIERWSFEKKQKLFIGCDPDYTRKFDVNIQTRLIMGQRYSAIENLDSLCYWIGNNI